MSARPTLKESLASAEAWFDRAWIRYVLAEGARARRIARKDFDAAAVTLASLRQCANTDKITRASIRNAGKITRDKIRERTHNAGKITRDKLRERAQ